MVNGINQTITKPFNAHVWAQKTLKQMSPTILIKKLVNKIRVFIKFIQHIYFTVV